MYLIYLINFLLAISTTVGMTIIPFLITDTLGLTFLVLGLIEGSTEFLSNIFRLLNGILFDKIKNKRIIFICSTGLAFISKISLLFFNPWAILCSKTLERVANGTFASPRDAYVAANSLGKGRALALLNVSKAFGCILGPLIVSVSCFFLGNLKDNLYFFIMLCCSLSFPAFLFSFTLDVKEIKVTQFSYNEIRQVFKTISPILLLSFLFFLGRFNDATIMLYLKEQGFPEWFYLSAIAIFNSIMILSSPIIGRMIDKNNLNKALFISISTLLIFNVAFFNIEVLAWPLALLGLLSWGIQRGAAQIVFSSIIFKSVPKENYGTAIGIYYLLSGIATMLSSFVCGYLGTHFDFQSVFMLSGFFAFITILLTGMMMNLRVFRFQTNLKLEKSAPFL